MIPMSSQDCRLPPGQGICVGMPSFSIVGLPDEVCRESRDRVRAAVMACDVTWPSQKITVNARGEMGRQLFRA